MQNAHLRLGLLEYHRITEKTSTRVRVSSSQRSICAALRQTSEWDSLLNTS